MSDGELTRQFRVLRQTIAMQAMLRDRYALRSLGLDIILLATAVVFCTTTFADAYIAKRLGLSAEVVRDILGVASVAAFFSSLSVLLLGWKRKAAQHGEAVKALTVVLSLYRQIRQDDGTWPENRRDELHQAYWDAMNSVVPIPDRMFLALKARYLRKVRLSKLCDSLPGCPVLLLRIIDFCRSIAKAARRISDAEKESTDDGSGGPTEHCREVHNGKRSGH